MIFDFKKFISINEGVDNKFKVGDYVVLHDDHGFQLADGEIVPPWQDSYGKIIKTDSLSTYLYVVKLTSEITDNIRIYLIDNHTILKNDYNIDLNNAILVHETYLKKYDSKEEFDKAVEIIKMERDIKKYNL